MEKQLISTISSDSDELISPEQLNRILNYDLRRTRKTTNFFQFEQIQSSQKRCSNANRQIKLNIWEKYLINNSLNSETNLSDLNFKNINGNNNKKKINKFEENLIKISLNNQILSKITTNEKEEYSNYHGGNNNSIQYKMSVIKNDEIILKTNKIEPIKQQIINKIYSKNAKIIKNNLKVDKNEEKMNASEKIFTTPSILSAIYPQQNCKNEFVKILENENFTKTLMTNKLREIFSDDDETLVNRTKVSGKCKINSDKVEDKNYFAQSQFKADFRKTKICSLEQHSNDKLKETHHSFYILDDSLQSVPTPESLKIGDDNYVNTINIISPLDSEDDDRNVDYG